MFISARKVKIYQIGMLMRITINQSGFQTENLHLKFKLIIINGLKPSAGGRKQNIQKCSSKI